jgi:ribosomal protein S18 acetylase RimI-like enzyme
VKETERLLLASRVRIAVCPPADPAARVCIRAYFAELEQRFENGFDPAMSISADDRELQPPAGLLLVATVGSEPLGCGALKIRDDGIAEVKRMWVAPTARGLGLGRRILNDLETHAVARNVRLLRLETNRSLTEAISLYRSAGYTEVAAFNDEPYADHWFEKRLTPAPPAAPARPRQRRR